MPDPFFSVVIPTYNRAAFIRPAIQSVCSQLFGDFEVIVVDDGSTDETETVVTAIPDNRIKYFRKPNGERGAARNFGVQQARGTYVNFLDSDDTFYPSHLKTAHDFLTKRAVEVCHLGFDIKDQSGSLIRQVVHLDDINRKILKGNVLSCNGVFARREVLLENPFSEIRALSSLEDWELWIRLCAKFTFHHVSGVTSTVVHHDERSVVSGKQTAIEAKVDEFISCVTSDAVNRQYFGNRLEIAVAGAHTYAALHLRMVGASRRVVWHHFSKALATSPGILFTRRSAVILLMIMGIK